MSFSALNIGTNMVTFTGNNRPQGRIASKPVAGGSFTPNTLEAAFVLRQSLDYQYETAFLTQYKQLMQNRLNALSTQLKDAYTNLLNTSMGQQIGENAGADVRADTILDGSNLVTMQAQFGKGGFEDLGENPSDNLVDWRSNSNKTGGPTSLTADRLEASGGLPEDNIFGYTRSLSDGTQVDFRALHEYTTAAGSMGGNMNITMRAEEDPPKKEQTGGLLGLLGRITSVALGGPPEPTYFNQKLEQNETQFKTGGFWSTVNYLYNFGPRELQYSYAVGYTVNSNEAGDDHILLEGKLLDIRDNVYAPNETPPGSHVNSDPNIFTPGHRVQWTSIDPTEGYTLEKSGTSTNYPTVTNRFKVLISGTETGSIASGEQIWDDAALVTDGTVAIVDNIPFQSGTRAYIPGQDIWAGVPTNSNLEPGTVLQYKVGWNGTANDTPNDGGIPVSSRGAIKSSLFMNHYEVETRTVEFNNSNRAGSEGSIYVHGGLQRSTSVDNSKNYDILAQDINGDGVVNPLGSPAVTNPITGDQEFETSITRSAGNAANTFNGDFVQGIHKIHSVNGQDIVNNEKQANPVIGNFEIGRYEGIERSYQMSRNIVPYKHPTIPEVNASSNVPTDWHQGELLVTAANANQANLQQGKIWFPLVSNTVFNNADGTGGHGIDAAKRQVIQARNTFKLSREELLQINPPAAWVTGLDGVQRPTYTKRDYVIDVGLDAVRYVAGDPTTHPKIFVNGTEIPPAAYTTALTATAIAGATDAHNITFSVNLRDYLREDLNTIVIQTADATYDNNTAHDWSEGIRVTPGAGNQAIVDAYIRSSIITGYDQISQAKTASAFERQGMSKYQSRWQTRLVPPSTQADTNNKLAITASAPETTGTSFKVANTFIEMIMEALNHQRYKDVFKLGLLSNLNKLAVSGQSSLPNGASMEGQLSLFLDPQDLSIVVNQDKLVAKS